MKSILFYWSKGAELRRRLVATMAKECAGKRSCYLSKLAGILGISHVALKKHVDLLAEEGYVEELNAGGKPTFLKLTREGEKLAKEFG
ncbi:MAG: hypothetical protein WC792_04865 [Candidatus Micrarchaeia archaeon]|jgi:predicted ArsR family transcriptional regulator